MGGAGLWNSNPTVKLSQDALIAAVEARGASIELLEADPRDPVNTMISNMDVLISEGVDALAYFPVDPNALTAPTERATSAGIPVLASEQTDGPVTAMFHRGLEHAAVMVADAVCAEFPDGASIVYGGYAQPDPGLIVYQETFIAALEQCSDGRIRIAAEFQNRTDDVAGALDPALAALQRVPDVQAIVNYSDVTAIGASRAATQLGLRDQVTIFGHNLAEDGIAAIRDGVIDYSIWSPVAVLGQYVGKQLVDVALGRQVPKYTVVWQSCYSLSNIDQLPTPDEQLAAVRAGESLLVDPATQLSTSDTEMPTTPPDGLQGCPTS